MNQKTLHALWISLREVNASQGVQEQSEELALLCYDLFNTNSMGADGQIFDYDMLDGQITLADERARAGSLSIAVKRTGLTRLLELLPERPASGLECSVCKGERFAVYKPLGEHKRLCLVCGGRGWVTDQMIAEARQAGWPI